MGCCLVIDSGKEQGRVHNRIEERSPVYRNKLIRRDYGPCATLWEIFNGYLLAKSINTNAFVFRIIY